LAERVGYLDPDRACSALNMVPDTFTPNMKRENPGRHSEQELYESNKKLTGITSPSPGLDLLLNPCETKKFAQTAKDDQSSSFKTFKIKRNANIR